MSGRGARRLEALSATKPGTITLAERSSRAASPLTWWERWEYPG